MGEAAGDAPPTLNLMLTGFGPFAAVTQNPTQEILAEVFNSPDWQTPGIVC